MGMGELVLGGVRGGERRGVGWWGVVVVEVDEALDQGVGVLRVVHTLIYVMLVLLLLLLLVMGLRTSLRADVHIAGGGGKTI